MATRLESATTFEPEHVIEPIYTGGTVGLSDDGVVLATCSGEEILLTNLATGRRLANIEGVSCLFANA